MTNKWIKNEICELTPENLRNLLDNKIPAIRISSFATPKEISYLTQACQNNHFDLVTESVKCGEVSIIDNLHTPTEFKYDYSGEVFRIGISQSEYTVEEKENYFNLAKIANQFLEKIKPHYDPINKLMQLLKQVNMNKDVIIAKENENIYFLGLIRQVNTGTYSHFDFAPFHAGPQWEIGKINAQLSWNLFLTQPLGGGTTIIYDCEWGPEIEFTRTTLSEPYSPDIIANCAKIESEPIMGDVVLFNSRNFHEVLPADTTVKRLTLSSFIGRKENGELIFWS